MTDLYDDDYETDLYDEEPPEWPVLWRWWPW